MPDTKTRERNQKTEDMSAMKESSHQERSATEAALESFRSFARERPETTALWCLGIGFVLGWKLKPW